MKMRSFGKPLIPLNGCKINTFIRNTQAFCLFFLFRHIKTSFPAINFNLFFECRQKISAKDARYSFFCSNFAADF